MPTTRSHLQADLDRLGAALTQATRELVRWPEAEPFAVRLSVAELTAPAPFSSFAGYQRWLVLLEGGPVTLALAGCPTVLTAPGDLVTFAGAAPAAATAVAGTSRDLNVMVSAALGARVEVVRGPATQAVAGAAVAVFTLAGAVAVATDATTALARRSSGVVMEWAMRCKAATMQISAKRPPPRMVMSMVSRSWASFASLVFSAVWARCSKRPMSWRIFNINVRPLPSSM